MMKTRVPTVAITGTNQSARADTDEVDEPDILFAVTELEGDAVGEPFSATLKPLTDKPAAFTTPSS